MRQYNRMSFTRSFKRFRRYHVEGAIRVHVGRQRDLALDTDVLNSIHIRAGIYCRKDTLFL